MTVTTAPPGEAGGAAGDVGGLGGSGGSAAQVGYAPRDSALQCGDEALPESVSPWTPGDSTPGMRPTSTGTGLSWLHAAQEMRPELASNLQLDYREATDLASNLDFAPPPARAKPPLRGRLRPDRSRGRASDSIKRPTLFAFMDDVQHVTLVAA